MPKGTAVCNSILNLVYRAVAWAGIADNAASAPLTNMYLRVATASYGLAPGSTVVTCTKPGGTKVRATWSDAQTAAITPGFYLVEFRTDDGPYCHEGERVELRVGVAP